MSLEHLVVPESKEMLRKKKKDTSKGHKSQLKELPMTKATTTVAKTNNSNNKIYYDYNPKYKINIHDVIVI